MTSLSLLPAIFIDFLGSALAIFLSFLALKYSRALVKMQPDNFIWGFLFYFCIAMTVFSLSRGVGHMVRIVLVFSDQIVLWKKVSPLSGGLNTLLMISAAAVTIYYHKGLEAYKAIRSEAEKLTDANTQLSATADQLHQLNLNLEEMVDERTRNLSESEKKFRNFFENSKDIIFFCDNTGHITHINTSGKQLLGINPAELKYPIHTLFANEEGRREYLIQLENNGFVSDVEMEYHTPDGQTKYILITANEVSDQQHNILGYEGIGKDMTRLKYMTEQLINHEKMASVGEMAAGVAHEINTPLGIILGYTQLMMDDFSPGDENYTNLEVVERQTKACKRIVADLLKFSRQAASAKSQLDLNGVIQDVLAVTEHSLNIQQIRVEKDYDLHLPAIEADAEKLRQVFINLFNNAQYELKESGGTITITTTTQDDQVVVTVRDNGRGIPEEIKKKIFDPFFTTKEVGKGTGLGLSVTYGIIQEHGGTIDVESPVHLQESAEAQPGTAFHIRLPISPSTPGNPKER